MYSHTYTNNNGPSWCNNTSSQHVSRVLYIASCEHFKENGTTVCECGSYILFPLCGALTNPLNIDQLYLWHVYSRTFTRSPSLSVFFVHIISVFTNPIEYAEQCFQSTYVRRRLVQSLIYGKYANILACN